MKVGTVPRLSFAVNGAEEEIQPHFLIEASGVVRPSNLLRGQLLPKLTNRAAFEDLGNLCDDRAVDSGPLIQSLQLRHGHVIPTPVNLLRGLRSGSSPESQFFNRRVCVGALTISIN